MSTSLAKQLQALCAPETSRFTKEHATSSFLFQPNQAADLDKDEIFLLALNGLEELECIFPPFSNFRKTLFSEESKNVERSVQSSKANENLDGEVASFLRLLSPFFLLKPAHKTLEWLIRRFQIHLYSVDELLKCSLPYHESKVFARVIQILDFKYAASKKWQWLEPFQKSGLPVSKQIILNHCCHDLGFMNFICELTKNAVENTAINYRHLTQTVVSFYMSTVIGVLKQSKVVSEELLTLITPFLVFGLKCNYKELVSSTYFILVYVNERVNLEESWLNSILIILLQNVVVGLEKEAVCSLAICLSSKTFESLSSKCWKLLLKKYFKVALEESSSKTVVLTLLRHLTLWTVKSLIKGVSKYLEKAEWLLEILEITEDDIQAIVKFAVKAISKEVDVEDKSYESIKVLLNILERKYPIKFERCIERYSDDENIFSVLLTTIGRNNMDEIEITTDTDLLVYLNHPNATYRICAMKALNSTKYQNKIEINDILIARAKDDDPSVVLIVLSSPKFSLLPPEEAKSILINLAVKHSLDSSWNKVTKLSLQMLSKIDLEKSEDAILIRLLPLLMPTSSHQLRNLRKIYFDLEEKVRSSLFWKLWKVVGKCAQSNSAIQYAKMLDAFVSVLPSCSHQETSVLFNEITNPSFASNAEEIFRIILLPLLIAKVAVEVDLCDNRLQVLINILEPRITGHTRKMIGKKDFKEVLIVNSHTEVCDLFMKYLKKDSSVVVASCYVKLYAFKVIMQRCSKSSYILHDLFKHIVLWNLNKQIYFTRPSQLLSQLYLKNCIANASELMLLLQKQIANKVDDYVFVVYCLRLLVNTLKFSKCFNSCDSLFVFLLPLCSSRSESVRSISLDCISHLSTLVKEQQIKKFITFLLSFGKEIENSHCYLSNAIRDFMAKEESEILNYFFKWILEESTTDFTKLGLLECLQNVTQFINVDQILPVLLKRLELKSTCDYQHEILKATFNLLSFSSFQNFENFNDLLDTLRTCLKYDLSNGSDMQIMTLDCVENVFKSCTEITFKRKLVEILLNQDGISKSNSLPKRIMEIMQRILFDGDEIAYHLEMYTCIEQTNSLREISSSALRESPIQRLLILESIESSEVVTNQYLIIPVLFKIIKQNLDMRNKNDYELELTMNVLHNICSNLELQKDKIIENDFNIELLIKCLQKQSSPRFHGVTLLTASSVASLFPDFVLHNAALIFAVISSGCFLHQDDNYSFGIIIATLEKVLPIIFNILLPDGDPEKDLKLVSGWMKVFVDALSDISDHRRMPLLTMLLSSVPSHSRLLWLLLASILEHYIATCAKGNVSLKGRDGRNSIMTLAVDFCLQFSLSEQISAVITLSNKLVSILKGDNLSFLHLESEKQKHLFCHANIIFISSLFSNHSFLTHFVDKDSFDAPLFTDLMNVVISLLSVIQRLFKKDANRWTNLNTRCYQLLDKATALLPEHQFIQIVDNLLQQVDVRLQCKVVEIFTVKLQTRGEKLEFEKLEIIFNRLIGIIKSDLKETNDSNQVMLRQLSLYSFKYLSRLFASQHKEAFQRVASVIIKLIHQETNVHVLSSAILCLAELCQSLAAHFIVYINKLLPFAMARITDDANLTKNELMLISLVTLLSKLVEFQEPFLSPHIDTILHKVCHLSSIYSKSAKSPLFLRLTTICRNLARKVEPRVLLPAVKTCYENVIDDHPEYLVTLMAILTEALRVTPDAVNVWHEYLASFYFDALGYRSTHKEKEEEEIILVERTLLEPILVLVMKMSEVVFRPFLIKLFDWATDKNAAKERLLTFYRLVNGIADKLQNLFALFAGHLLLNMTELMESNNSIHQVATSSFEDFSKIDVLLCCIFDILSVCFAHGNKTFLNQERFLTLMPQLVDQLENEMENYEERIKHLIPCLSLLTRAVTPDVNLQSFVYRILLKTRSSSFKVRCAGLESVRQVAKKLNEDFLSLLPETIPFLAELMEDEVLEVEQLSRLVIQDLEEIVGEPLQKYFIS